LKVRKKILLKVLYHFSMVGMISFYFVLLSFSSSDIKKTGYQIIRTEKIPDDEKFFTEKEAEILINQKIQEGNTDLKYNSIYRTVQEINKSPYLVKSELSALSKGKLQLKLYQRVPMFRVQNYRGEHFYVDTSGNFFPCKMDFASDVPFVSGYVYESWYRCKKLSMREIEKNEKLTRVFVMDDVWKIINAIEKDSVLRLNIRNYYVNEQQEIVLIPNVGKHKIIFGGSERMTYKLKKLWMFYRDAAPFMNLNEYSSINLKFKNQIVCRKKNIHP